MGIVRKRVKPDQRVGGDSIYGSGYDGDMVVASSTTFVMNRDYHFNNLTISANAILATNGYRVFVKGVLTVSNGARVGMPTSVTTVNPFGSVIGRADDNETGITKQYVVGDSSSGTAVPSTIVKNLNFLLRGWHYDPVDGFKRAEGGDDGQKGADVAGTSGGAGGLGTAGSPGNAGGAGGAGGYAPSPSNPGNPGTAGNPGAAGNAGTDGNPGNPGSTGIGGEGGEGGGLSLIVAKNIVYSGSTGSAYFESFGRAGYEGSKGADGTAGTAGVAGNKGADGTAGTAGNAGNSHTGAHNPAVYYAGETNVSGHSAGHHNHHQTSHTVPGNEIHAQTEGGATLSGNQHCKNNHHGNTPRQITHYTHNTHNVHYNNAYGGLQYHSHTKSVYAPVTSHHTVPQYAGQHCSPDHNPNHFHYYGTGQYNPATTAYGNAESANKNPDTPNYHHIAPSYTAAHTTPDIAGGTAGAAGAAGVGGAGGAAGAAGAAGIGGTGSRGTQGLRGGLFIVCDSISSTGITIDSLFYGAIFVNSDTAAASLTLGQ